MAASGRRTSRTVPTADLTGKALLEAQEAQESAQVDEEAVAATNARGGVVAVEEDFVVAPEDEFLPPSETDLSPPEFEEFEDDIPLATPDIVRFRVAEDLVDMTFGGAIFTFQKGRLYQGSRALALHLDEKGFLVR